MIIELVEDVWIDPFAVTVVKAISKKKCALWVTGQSALEGFVLDHPASEVVQAINDAIENPDDESEEEEPEEGEEEDQNEV